MYCSSCGLSFENHKNVYHEFNPGFNIDRQNIKKCTCVPSGICHPNGYPHIFINKKYTCKLNLIL